MRQSLSELDLSLLAAIEPGLPLTTRPYAALAEELGIDEEAVLDRLAALQEDGTISRFGVVVRHHELGYRANAMVVWDVDDGLVDDCGQRLAGLPFITLSYRRPRRPPIWRYNLFCMIHGKSRERVLEQVTEAETIAGLTGRPRSVLFSGRRFKQRGARYGVGRADREAVA